MRTLWLLMLLVACDDAGTDPAIDGSAGPADRGTRADSGLLDADRGLLDADRGLLDADIALLDATRDAAPTVDRGPDVPRSGDARAADSSPVDAGPEPIQCAEWPGAPWLRAVDEAPLHARSTDMIAWLAERGWGNNDRFQIDFSIEVLRAGPEVELRPFETTGDHFSPDCDEVPVPVPAGGALEGEQGYACESDGDCHLIVYQGDRLYEMWRADIRAGVFRGGCLAVWQTTANYPATWRGEQCTSADAAGLPIAPLLFSADEVAAGEIAHAIRFILPNDRIRNRTYVRPATHATGAASGGELAPPYGARLRLRADYPVGDLAPGAQVVARALQTYGMILADGGQIALTGQSDRSTTAKWAGLLTPHDLRALQVADFQVVDSGPTFPWSGDCVRSDPEPCGD